MGFHGCHVLGPASSPPGTLPRCSSQELQQTGLGQAREPTQDRRPGTKRLVDVVMLGGGTHHPFLFVSLEMALLPAAPVPPSAPEALTLQDAGPGQETARPQKGWP